MEYETPRFLDCGEAALSVEFGDSVDPAINARVLALDERLHASALAGLRETTPTYRALFLRYEPLEISRDALIAAIQGLIDSGQANPCDSQTAVRWTIPCCYDPEFAEDIVEAAELLGQTARSLAQLHAGADYRAYMYGFAPGWCYLGGLPDALAIPRRTSPRGLTPQGATLIGGALSLIAANPMPTGWYVIGRTPERMFALDRDPPFLIAPGDAVRFEPIDPETFGMLDARALAGETVARRETLK
ncbi:MAG: allophanate hydrolase subunit 1 [Alphaproteobacteria bacterium]|jgi:KipI family sensor histidine kinase inhibitor|nr:allophanate hydrolase subunit 1 [Alphaproteobacteria bacterium]MBM3639929.1 allophanate hydrolase subunit 1 [Alphaproteobacteria bacterium]